MPFKRTFRRFKRRPYRRPKRKAQISRIHRVVDKLSETKHLDYNSGTNTPGTTWLIYCLSNINQGAQINQRIGDKVSAKYLKGKITMLRHASSAFDQCRVIIFKDKESRGAVPSSSDLGLDDGNPMKALSEELSLDTNYFNRFVKLMDKTASFDNSQHIKNMSIRIPLRMPLFFETQGSGYARNAIFLAVVCYDNSNLLTLSSNTRLFWKDM